MIEIRRVYDENNWDTLIGRRLEVFFNANLDGTPSVDGHVIFHCEWECRTNGELRATVMGPQVRFPISDLLGGTFNGVPGPELVMAIKDAFLQTAAVHGELVEVEVPISEPEPEPEPENPPTEGEQP